MWTSMLVVASLLVSQGPATQQPELARRVAVLIRQLDDDRDGHAAGCRSGAD